ncbi:LEAF RUST 10 DISEASE-RESISTANCE LOCUS RECEPTOR-LIKE PROTEIN KINASE-like 2.7 [Magnolia sinica]|uniref:LEAF RUST 10 DISEASE-RESISTANCE LOCUS RECEPTOR-LIKE PROTEIN KINASE-like 2.7 n=1 Tax=Magnolia sinica TaxID=86752 RepID=UPI0026581D7E|nr:LEAF RUST 10 DISEASE-RESISTANCE LOCUS RECEPTOR-LIKE PROTEIN KINASE-like 2.7 [Magnolia sinica]
MSPFLHLLLIFILDGIPVISSCSSFVCGNLNFTYPFYQINATSLSLCGYEGLGISCLDQNPTFNISDDAYTVKFINYRQSTFTLVESSLVGESCPRPRHNISWEYLSLFELTAHDKNLSFYFNCSSFPSWGRPISCLGYGSMKSYAAIEESGDFNWDEMCEEKVIVPVLESAGSGSLVGAVQQGFKLQWKIRRDCENCESIGGFCGKSNTEERFLCFCKNGTNFSFCNFTPPNGQQPVPTNADVPSTSPNGQFCISTLKGFNIMQGPHQTHHVGPGSTKALVSLN